jgi:flagellar basal-body rod protein FlgF
MDRALYVAMTGAIETMRAQQANNNNLANASTTGFRAELIGAQAVAVEGSGLPSRVNSQLVDQGWDATPGAVMQTGRDLDVALRPGTWLAVQGMDGSEAYTRAGNLQVDSGGQLLTASGQAVLGDGGPISLPGYSSLSIASDGTISIIAAGQAANAPAVVGRLRVVSASPGQLDRNEDGLMSPARGQTLDGATGNTVTSGALENSNVDLAGSMVTMISLSRQFELQTKLMKSVQDNAAAAASLLQLR